MKDLTFSELVADVSPLSFSTFIFHTHLTVHANQFHWLPSLSCGIHCHFAHLFKKTEGR